MNRVRSKSSWRFYFSTVLKGAKQRLKLPVCSTRHLAVPVVVVAVFGLMAASPVKAGDVAAGSDLFDTSGPLPSGPATTYDALSLPANFFGDNSLLWQGMVSLQGNSFAIPGSSGDVMVDTIVERLDDATFAGDPTQDTVNTQMKALSLIGTSWITVSFDGSLLTSQYEVRACLSSSSTQPTGSMTIKHLCPEGGRFDSITSVIPKLMFSKMSGILGYSSVVMDPAPQLDFNVINGCWSHTDPGYDLATTPGGTVDHDCAVATAEISFAASTPAPDGFYAGVCWYPCIGGGVAAPMQSSPTAELGYIDEIELLARHGIGPGADTCRVAPDGQSCEGDCPDPEICVPKRIRRIPGAAQGPDFPPAGIDILTRTGGWIVIHDKSVFPEGEFRTYNINPEPPNITVVQRSEPYYDDIELRNQIDTEIVEMELSAHDGGGGGGGVFVHLNTDLPSDGVIHPVTTTGEDFPAESFFDVYMAIEIPGMEEMLYNMAPIPLGAHGIMEIPPYEAEFRTPPAFGADLYYGDGTMSPYWIVEVVHWLPPPPPPHKVIDCECIDPDDPADPDICHPEIDASGEVFCVGPCPPGEECNRIGHDTDGDGIPDEFECLCSTPPDFHASPTNDSWITFDDAGDVPSLPYGFFGPGSDPFDGLVYLEGDPIDPDNMGDTSTVLLRSADPFEPSDPVSYPLTVTVEIKLVELSLKSVEPIVVTYTGGPAPELWDVHVGLSPTVPPDPSGELVATKTHANGGTYDVTICVIPLLTFTRVSDGTTVELDWAELDPPYGDPFVLQGSNNSWVHGIDPSFDAYYHPEADWIGGIEETEPGDTSSQVRDPLAVLPPDGEDWLVHGVIPPRDPWYWKDYNAGEPDGYMPDFDQNQDFDNADGDNDPVTGPDTGYCGPTAVANSLWWFDHKFPDTDIVNPGTTVVELIEELAGYMGTNDGADHPSPNGHPEPYRGTYVDDMQTGIDNYLDFYGLTDLLYEHTQPMPSFDYIANEVERCQDVVLLLGFWHIEWVDIDPASGEMIIEWARHGGHYVTVAGVNRVDRMIAISDPDADAAEAGAPGVVRGIHNHGHWDFRDAAYDHTLHNDKPLASHDFYGVGPSPSPGGHEALLAAGDPLIYGPAMVTFHTNENEDSSPVPIPITYPPGAWDVFGYPWPEYCQYYTEIEYAVIVSPYEGACCLTDNTCIITTEPECTAQSGSYHGNNTQCEGMEACCLPDNTCVMADRLCCRTDLGGVPQGQFSVCTQPEACCLSNGTCIMVDPLCCDDKGGVAHVGSVCRGMQACCLDNNTCVMADALCCVTELNGLPQGTGSVCQGMQACCLDNNTCVMADALCCVNELNGVPQGLGSFCLGMQACCLDDNTCVMADALCCVNQLNGIPEGTSSTCGGWQACCLPDDTCENADSLCCVNELFGTPLVGLCTAPQACCFTDGSCRDLDPLCCDDLGGTPQGPLTACTVEEACCLENGDCIMVDPLCCDEMGGVAQGAGKVCTAREACCFDDRSCQMLDPVCCEFEGGHPSPIGAACMGDPNGNGMDDACEPLQACCLADGTCQDLNHTDCVNAGGDPQGPDTDCTGVVECQRLKWAQPPTYSPLSPRPECFWGWDDPSMYDWPFEPIVADDFLCVGPLPITDVHWWGSYEHYLDPLPPDWGPPFFHIGIWTDVPAGVDQPFSHPGVMVWDWVVRREDLNERSVGCDFYPALMDVPETCFRYDFVIPQSEWYYQPGVAGDPTIHWISIAAWYPLSTDRSGYLPWGWKTRQPNRWDAAVRILSPIAPVRLDAYVDGIPIEEPEGVRWDMAFVLTTSCPPSDPPLVPAGEAGFEKVRYISMEPVNPGRATALRVTMTTIPPPYEALSGTRCWVGEPAIYCENAGVVTPPCPPVIPNTDFVGADLGGTPHCMDWSTVGVLHVSDDDIVPGAVYDVQAIDCLCDYSDEANYSAPLTITTSIWGDAVRNCAVYPCGPPDGLVGIPTDVTAILDKFKNLEPPAFAPSILKSRGDLDWNIPNRRIDISDVTFCLDAFRGVTYPPLGPALWPGPDGCP
ncbi:MAG: hypothetical protein JSU86_00640 [Phycisphaerales bacterium]|nr:MAG: hypothetical protein JSU86_00640 [Phycisphaerales bacterium]